MLRAQARVSFRVRLSDKRGSPFLKPRVQTASISSSRPQKNLFAPPLFVHCHHHRLDHRPLHVHHTFRRSPFVQSQTRSCGTSLRPTPLPTSESTQTSHGRRASVLDGIGCGLEGLARFSRCRNLLVPSSMVPSCPTVSQSYIHCLSPSRPHSSSAFRNFKIPRTNLLARPDSRSVQHRDDHPLARL